MTVPIHSIKPIFALKAHLVISLKFSINKVMVFAAHGVMVGFIFSTTIKYSWKVATLAKAILQFYLEADVLLHRFFLCHLPKVLLHQYYQHPRRHRYH
jgi:hypothetical protein